MRIQVIAHPNSKRPRVEKDLLGVLQIYVQQAPQEGRANQAVVAALADYFKVSKSKVELVKGEKSKQKVFKIFILHH